MTTQTNPAKRAHFWHRPGAHLPHEPRLLRAKCELRHASLSFPHMFARRYNKLFRNEFDWSSVLLNAWHGLVHTNPQYPSADLFASGYHASGVFLLPRLERFCGRYQGPSFNPPAEVRIFFFKQDFIDVNWELL